MSKHWYTTTARNYDCNDHPRQPKMLAPLLSEYTGMPEIEARQLIDRVRHLSHCLEEPVMLTLKRLTPGKRQLPKGRHESRE